MAFPRLAAIGPRVLRPVNTLYRFEFPNHQLRHSRPDRFDRHRFALWSAKGSRDLESISAVGMGKGFSPWHSEKQRHIEEGDRFAGPRLNAS